MHKSKTLNHPVAPFPYPVVPVEYLKEDLEEDLAITLPTPLRSKDQHLYQKLKGSLQWNDKGEILMEDNHPISRSHITDLINTAIQTKRKIRKFPTGWEYFNQKLQEANIPERLLGRDPQFLSQEEEWKLELKSKPESEKEWEPEQKPKNPIKKYKWESTYTGKHPLISFSMTRETDHEGILSLFTE